MVDDFSEPELEVTTSGTHSIQDLDSWVMELDPKDVVFSNKPASPLDELRLWVAELQSGKDWLEQQVKNWQQEAENRANYISELKNWIIELEHTKIWMQQQIESWQKEAEVQSLNLSELKQWVAELEIAKTSLEEQVFNWKSKSELQNEHIKSLEMKIAGFETGSLYIEKKQDDKGRFRKFLLKLNNLQQQTFSKTPIAIFALFILYFCIWAGANYPALKQGWWYVDDYSLISNSWEATNKFFLSEGRPLSSLWALTFFLDNSPDKIMVNMFLHIFQGGIHSLTATLIVYLLFRYTKNKLASALSVLPFLIWPFNGDAVLWRTGAVISLAAFLSILGLLCLLKWHCNRLMAVIGIALIMLSMLSHQVGALGALIVFVILLCLNLLEIALMDKKHLTKTGILLLLGYCLSGLSSFFITGFSSLPRSSLVSDVPAKFKFLTELIRLFFSGEFYPHWLSILQVFVLGWLVLLLVFLSFLKLGWKQRLRFFLLVAVLFVVPWATLLIVAENWPSWRVMYLAPLIFTGLFFLVLSFAYQKPFYIFQGIRLGTVALLCILMFGYFRVSWVNAEEYLQLFQNDLSNLNRIEAIVDENKLSHQICVIADNDYVRTWNPYKLRYMYADSKLSAFIVPWAAPGLVTSFSHLSINSNPVVKQKAVSLCKKSTKTEAFQTFITQPENILCVCP